MGDLLTVLSFCWRYFGTVFPYTSARLQHWLHFLSHANLNTLDHPSSILPPILPLYLYVLTSLVELYLERTRPPDQAPPGLQIVIDALLNWSQLYLAMEIFLALLVVITTPGFLAKFIVALDLCLDFYLTEMAQFICRNLFIIPIQIAAAVVYLWRDGALAEALAQALDDALAEAFAQALAQARAE